jgi:hypothetical protein
VNDDVPTAELVPCDTQVVPLSAEDSNVAVAENVPESVTATEETLLAIRMDTHTFVVLQFAAVAVMLPVELGAGVICA